MSQKPIFRGDVNDVNDILAYEDAVREWESVQLRKAQELAIAAGDVLEPLAGLFDKKEPSMFQGEIIEGPSGPAGAKGADGADGPAGDTGPPGSTNWLGLTDTDPASYVGQAGEAVRVNSGETGLEFFTPGLVVPNFDGFALQHPKVSVTYTAGPVVNLLVELAGGGNFDLLLDGDVHTFTSATIALTAGTDAFPQLQFVWIELIVGVPTLQLSTTSFPTSGTFMAVATVFLQTAASAQANGIRKVHAWTDFVGGDSDQGHSAHMNHWVRHQPATWQEGVVPTVTIVGASSPDDVFFSSTSGTVLQLHDHNFPAIDMDGVDEAYVVNDPTTPYDLTTNLNTHLTDAAGGSMSGRAYSLVIWGVVSEDTGDCQLMVNLPLGSYSQPSSAIEDALGHSVFSIPAEFLGTGFLIARVTLDHSPAGGGTFTLEDTSDLRGLKPNSAAGASSASVDTHIGNLDHALDANRTVDDGNNGFSLTFDLETATGEKVTVVFDPVAPSIALTSDNGAGGVRSIAVTPASVVAAGRNIEVDGTKLDGIASGATNNIGALANLDSVDTGEIDQQAVGTTEIANKAVTNTKLASVASQTIKGRITDATGDPEDLTASQVQSILDSVAVPPIRFLFADFNDNGASRNDPFIGSAISGGNTSGAPSTAALADAFGVVLMRSTTTANSGYAWRQSTNKNRGRGDLFYRVRLWVDDDFTNKTITIGFHNSSTATEPTRGSYFRLSGSGTVTPKNADTTRTSDATFVISADTWYWFEIHRNVGSTSVNFKILPADGVSAPLLDVDITGDITTGEIGAGIVATSSVAATDNLCSLDYQGYGLKTQR